MAIALEGEWHVEGVVDDAFHVDLPVVVDRVAAPLDLVVGFEGFFQGTAEVG